jgi:hypothetical protein
MCQKIARLGSEKSAMSPIGRRTVRILLPGSNPRMERDPDAGCAGCAGDPSWTVAVAAHLVCMDIGAM